MKQSSVQNIVVLSLCFAVYVPVCAEQVLHHVVVTAKKEPQSLQEHEKFNQLLKKTIADLNQKTQEYAGGPVLGKSLHYAHKKDVVFPVRYNSYFGHCTLHIPSYISYDDFVTLAETVFANQGLQIGIEADYTVQVEQNSITGLEGQYLTLQELDEYSSYTKESDFDAQITQLTERSLAHPLTANKDQEHIALLKKMKAMRPYFFWHVENPTVGMYTKSVLNIPAGFEPISWKFSLWELAPLQGKGIKIGVIDTGLAGFKIENEPAAKQNINAVMPNMLQQYGYNLVADNGLNPFEQFALQIEQYCDSSRFDYQDLLQNLPEMITDFLKTKDFSLLEKYLIEHLDEKYLQTMRRLNEEGKKILKMLLYGAEGILPQNNEHQSFHLAHVQAPYQATVVKEAIPYPKVSSQESTFVAGHGTFTACLVAGKQIQGKGVSGIAPQAELIMIKAFNDQGVTNKSTLISALELALLLQTDLVSMSLKVTDSINVKNKTDQTLERVINAHDYVIAASGNNGDSKLPDYAGKKEAYPARFESVAFDVGSFSYDNGRYPICQFTQMEPNIGPKFAAPGFNILSAGLVPDQKQDSMYVFMDGTSVSVPIVTGYVALVLAEFKEVFTKEQLLSVMYKCSIRLDDSADWQTNMLLGACDMRTALLCLRVLESIKKDMQDKIFAMQFEDVKENIKSDASTKNKIYSFDEKFNQLTEAICTIMFYVPLYYGKQIGVDLSKNMVGYARLLVDQEITAKPYFSVKKGSDPVMQAVEFIKRYVYAACNKESNLQKSLHEELLQSVSSILTADTINLFAHLPQVVQARLQKAITWNSLHKNSFWKKQANHLKNKKG